MDFDYSEEQKLLEASLGKLLARQGAAQAGEAGGERIWAGYAELGLLGMAFDEADGGLGTGPVETMIVMRAIGRELCTAPYLASAVHGARLLRTAASDRQKAELVPALIDGTARLAVAHAEPGSRYRLDHVELAATAEGGGFVLSGRKSLVPGGASATHVVVSGRTSGAAADRDGITLFLVPRAIAGLRATALRTIDGRTAAELVFDRVSVAADSVLGSVGKGIEALEDAADHATVAVINEAAGAMEALLSLTVDHLKTRHQFGVAIGSFQALQHRAVDMFVEVEQAKSMALHATMQLGLDATERRAAIGSAKLHVNRAARLVGEAAVQLHGAMGMTLESKAGRLFNRLTACQIAFGDSDFWLASLLDDAPDILAV